MADDLDGVDRAQKLHELVADLSRGFVLYPVAHVVELDASHETGKAGAQLINGQWVEFLQSICLPHHVKRWLRNLRALKSSGQVEVWLGSPVVVQATVEAGALEFSNIMGDIIWLRPGW